MKNTNFFFLLFLVLLCIALTAQTDNVVYPYKYDTKLQDVHVAANDAGFAVGSCGVILQTSDGGDNWSLASVSGSSWDYTSVLCPDDDCDRAIIAGDGILLRWQAGGEFTIDVSEDFRNVLALHGLDNQVVIADRNGSTYLRSTDGGATWTEMSLPENRNQSWFLTFANGSTGFVMNANRQLLKTTDAGATWTMTGHTSATGNTAMHWRTPLLGWYQGGSGGDIYKSSDGGVTFEKLDAVNLPRRLYFLSSLSDEHLVGLGFVNEVQESLDGGKTWNRTFLPEAPGNRPAFYGNFHQRGNEFFSPSDGNEVYRSPANFTGWEGTIPADRRGSGPVAFINDQVGIVAGSSSFLIKTTNGGDTWTQLTTGNQNTNAPVSAIDFRSEQEFVLYYGNDYPRITTDGGATFRQYFAEETGIAQGEADVFHNFADGRILVMGRHDFALSNADQSSWTIAPHDFKRDIYAVHFPTETVGYAVGNGLLAKTIDGGQTWTELTAPAFNQNGRYVGVHFYDELRGVIGKVSSGGYLTTDGGQSWIDNGIAATGHIAHDPVQDVTYSVSFESSNNGYLNRSLDRGESWQRVSFMCAAGAGLSVTPSGDYVYLGAVGSHVEKHAVASLTNTSNVSHFVAPLRAYPNPTSGRVTLDLPVMTTEAQLRVFALDGRLITSLLLPAGTERYELNLGVQTAGVYLLAVMAQDGKRYSGRVLVQ